MKISDFTARSNFATTYKGILISFTVANMASYSCRICESAFVQKSLFIVHQKRCLGITEYKCDECDFEAITEDQVKKHKVHKHGDGKLLECQTCGEKFRNSIALRVHKRQAHGVSMREKATLHEGTCRTIKQEKNTIFACERCDFQCERKSAMTEHIKRCQGIKDNKCPKCDFVAVTKKEIEYHVTSKHSAGKLECDICGKVLKNILTLQVHKRTLHGERKVVQCKYCQTTTHRKESMIQHERRCQGIKDYKCDMCEYTAVTLREIKNHKEYKHSNGNLYDCDLCPKQFKTKYDVQSHKQMVHCEVKEVRCTLCPYLGAIKANLRSHMITHQMERPFECEMCGKTFKTRPNLDIHMKTLHGSTEEFPCDQCDKKIQRKGKLASHRMWVHGVGAVAVACKQCDFVAKTKSSLRYHIKYQHSEIQWLKCYHCDYRAKV